MPPDRVHRPDRSSRGPSSGGGPSRPSASLADIQTEGTYFLGRYRIVDELGVGGMASVHLARMDGPGGFQKWVAIKRIHAHLVEDDSFVQMFLDEARVAARISHPNVATVFDLGKHEDTYWLAMEYLHGEPLREVMRRTEELGTAMPPEIACRVIADAAEGLHAAHELLGKNGEKLGLVHRDVTPHNLFVTYEGVTKVVDFGIAKFSSRMSHTRTGTLKGKLAYMSPEQVHAEGIDRRTDVFALGVVLWELTTGQRLFRMENDIDTLAKVQECAVPRPSTLVRGYPLDLEKIVMKALSRNRGERFRTARELSRALQSLLMKRGLFIASDEVAAYTHSLFADRIQKREAHLRWAAEVTQTINVDSLLSSAKASPDFTASEVQAAEFGRGPSPTPGALPPLPAAGAPPHAPLGPAAMSQPHPADRDGPTIQSPSMTVDDFLDHSFDPPTLMDPSSRQRLQPSGGALTGAEAIEPESLDDDEDDDQAQTIVAREPGAPFVPAPAVSAPSTSNTGRAAPRPFNPTRPSDPMAVDATRGMPMTGIDPHGANDYGPRASHPREPLGHALSPFGAEIAQPGPLPSRPPSPLGQLGHGQRTTTAQRFKRRPPMWAVAAISCSLALLIAGIVFVIVSTTSGEAPRTEPKTGATGASAPFEAARAAFDEALHAAPPTAPTVPAVAPLADDPLDPAGVPLAATQPASAPVQTAHASAPRAPGALTVVCTPKCDQIIDNGTSLGPGHIFNRPVPSGRHALVLSAPNGVKKALVVEILPDQTKEVRLSMAR